ncbi:hypothetical protein [Rummeliibacillus pycnus]|uniref:hypothetical protein n=1 Tax=Rummeliibacillus pycnus TaxID=101070 RepID=UPI003D2B04F1
MNLPQFPGGQNFPPMGTPPGFPGGPPSGFPGGPPSGFPGGPPSGFPGGPPSGFPGGPPSGFPGGPPSGFPGGGPPSGQMPTAAPPEAIPFMPTWQQQGSTGIHSCLFSNTYIWTFDGANFWFFPIAVTRDQIFGYRWSSRNRRWSFRVVNRRNILHYQCFR